MLQSLENPEATFLMQNKQWFDQEAFYFMEINTGCDTFSLSSLTPWIHYGTERKTFHFLFFYSPPLTDRTWHITGCYATKEVAGCLQHMRLSCFLFRFVMNSAQVASRCGLASATLTRWIHFLISSPLTERAYMTFSIILRDDAEVYRVDLTPWREHRIILCAKWWTDGRASANNHSQLLPH